MCFSSVLQSLIRKDFKERLLEPCELSHEPNTSLDHLQQHFNQECQLFICESFFTGEVELVLALVNENDRNKTEKPVQTAKLELHPQNMFCWNMKRVIHDDRMNIHYEQQVKGALHEK